LQSDVRGGGEVFIVSQGWFLDLAEEFL
jgi:hypothetical protein